MKKISLFSLNIHKRYEAVNVINNKKVIKLLIKDLLNFNML